MALLLCSVVAGVTIAGGVWTYLRFSEKLTQEEFARQSLAAASIEAEIHATIRDLREDVASLATVPAVTGLLRARRGQGVDQVSGKAEHEWRKELESHFRDVFADRPDYAQVRLIGVADSGREIVRVERQGERILVTPDKRLQHKGQRRYFREAMALVPGDIFVSELELNEELGRVVVPHMPVLRVAIPIYDSTGAPQAVVVINTDLRPLLDHFERTLADYYSLYLFDNQGRFLLHPDRERRFVPQLGSAIRVTEEFPGLGFDMDGSAVQSVVEHAPSERKMVADLRGLGRDADPSHAWGLLVTQDYSHATAAKADLARQIIAWGSTLLVLTLGTVMLFSRSLTRPLRQITHAVEQLGRGAVEPNLPLRARDEAGVLARAFDEMSRQVREHDASMKKEVGVRRRAEEALREAERQLRLALDAAQAGVWVWDLKDHSTSRDKTAEKILGLPSGAKVPRRWTERLHLDDRPVVDEKLRLAKTGNLPFDAEFRLSDDNGYWKHIKARAITVLGKDKQPVKLIGVCWDVSGEKAVRDRVARYGVELKRKNDELEQFVYSVSHDLKSPLVTCKAYMGLLQEDLRDGNVKDALDSAMRIEKAADYMKSLIEDLLELSRAGAVEAQEMPVDVEGLLRTVIEECRSEFPETTVEVRVEADTPNLRVDPIALRRVFQNLISNAFKYGCHTPNPRVEIGGLKQDDETWFFVKDYGSGIEAEYQEKVFRLFQRLETTKEGTGIGLAIVKKIVDGYGGRAWVESEAGKGTTFWVAFPDRAPDRTLLTIEEALV